MAIDNKPSHVETDIHKSLTPVSISAGTCRVATKISNRIPLFDCGNPAISPLRCFNLSHRHLIYNMTARDREAPSNKNSER